VLQTLPLGLGGWVGVGITSAIYGLFSDRMERSLGIKRLEKRLDPIHKAAERFLVNDSRIAYWAEWEDTVKYADWRALSCQRQFYTLRLVVLISAITVPSLVGLNLSGTGGSVARWLTFSFSLVTAISTGIIALYRVGDRWLMYRKLRQDLMKFFWTLLESSSANSEHEWNRFVKSCNEAIANYNRAYETVIIHTVQLEPKPDDGDNHHTPNKTTKG
jgi:hypothetical protein